MNTHDADGRPLGVLVVAKQLPRTDPLLDRLATQGCEVLGVADDAEAALTLNGRLRPSLAVFDLRGRPVAELEALAVALHDAQGVPLVFVHDASHQTGCSCAAAARVLGVPCTTLDGLAGVLRTLADDPDVGIRRRNRWVSATLRVLSEGLIAVDANGVVTYLNPVAEQLLGITSERAVGARASDVLQQLQTSETSPLKIAMTERRPAFASAALRDPAREPTSLAEHAVPVLDGHRVQGAILGIRDVTAEERLQRQLDHANRLTLLGRLVASTIHESAGPLCVLATSTALLQDWFAAHAQALEAARPQSPALDAAGARAALSDLAISAEQLLALFKELRDFARPGARAPGTTVVASAVDWACRATWHELNRVATVETRVPTALQVRLEATRLRQLLLNAVTNAVHAMRAVAREHHKLSITAWLDGDDFVKLSVTDSGCGIPKQQLDRVFDPFFSTKLDAGGTGLGLAICKGIVTEAGGTIDLTSVEGSGTTVTFRLPAFRPPQA